jgi:hypothetical protein
MMRKNKGNGPIGHRKIGEGNVGMGGYGMDDELAKTALMRGEHLGGRCKK